MNATPSSRPSDETPLSLALGEFLHHNPEAELVEDEGETVVANPWDDDSIELRVSENDSNLISTLNQLRLPPMFTAIWHRDSKDFEVIFTAYGAEEELMSRTFTLQLDGQSFDCEYGRCSDRLLALADAAEFVAAPRSETAHRNLNSFQIWLEHQEESEYPDSPIRDRTPVSFWIRNLEISEESLAQVARHINFYMRYYDRQTPRILVHEVGGSQREDLEKVRYPHGNFPDVITGHKVDSYLLGLWESALDTHDVVKTYLHFYQVLEYASHYHIRDEVHRKLKRLLREPRLHSRTEQFARKAVDLLTADERHQTHKFEATIRDLVDPRVIWQAVEANKHCFCEQTSFEGGFVIEPLVREDWTFDDFETSWLPRFPNTIRETRNALVHARERQQADVISPSTTNIDKLRPWLQPLERAAERVIVQWEG